MSDLSQAEELTDQPVRRICRHCEEAIEYLPGIGWVEVRSGDDGGHYDFCTEQPDHGHTPTRTEGA